MNIKEYRKWFKYYKEEERKETEFWANLRAYEKKLMAAHEAKNRPQIG